jgi:hypothetical protein
MLLLGHRAEFRRLSAIIAGSIALVFPAAGRADEAVRLSWQDFAKDPTKVANLRKAVAAMRARNSANHASAQYRQSWEYWANIHGYFGPESPFGTVAQNRAYVEENLPSAVQFFDGITDQSPQDQVAQDVWANCQHSSQTQINPWFFA